MIAVVTRPQILPLFSRWKGTLFWKAGEGLLEEGRMAGFESAAQNKNNEQAEMSFAAIRDQWEIHFSRFVCYPSSTSTSTNLSPLLSMPEIACLEARGSLLSSTVFMQLLHYCSTSDLFLPHAYEIGSLKSTIFPSWISYMASCVLYLLFSSQWHQNFS